ncbi:MAG TPA: hypothetical protein VMJ32_10825 [Pirellulales bacterium]|nr:hypothetical protein [Pirellulales bacterium]
MILLIAILQTALVVVIIPVYWRQHGWKNFLWMSDIALFGSTIALWWPNRLLVSTEAVSVLVLEIVWGIDILLRLILGSRFAVLSKYMFQREIPLWIRLLSLFHVWLPWLLLWQVMQTGYDPRALVVQTVVWWVVVTACYFISTPEENINCAHGVGQLPQRLTPVGYLILLLFFVPVCVYVPTHFFLGWVAGG